MIVDMSDWTDFHYLEFYREFRNMLYDYRTHFQVSINDITIRINEKNYFIPEIIDDNYASQDEAIDHFRKYSIKIMEKINQDKDLYYDATDSRYIEDNVSVYIEALIECLERRLQHGNIRYENK